MGPGFGLATQISFTPAVRAVTVVIKIDEGSG